MISSYKIFFNLLTNKLKKNFLINVLGSFVVMVFEIFSIALIFPAIGFLLNEDISEANPFMKTDLAKFIFVSFRDLPLKNLIFYFLLFFGFIYLCKVVITLFFAWRNASFAFNVRTHLAKELNHLYIHQPFSFHITNNSSKITHNLNQEINIIAQGCNSTLIFITEFTVLVGLILFFIIYQPFITIIIFLILIPSFYIFKKIRRYVEKLSKRRQYHDKKTIFFITQIFSGLKDLAILNKSKIFSERYNNHVIESSKANTRNSFIAHIPRNILELLLIVGIIVICIFLPIEQNNFKNEILKIMAAFAIASFRLMPAITRIIVSINVMSFMLPVLNSFYQLHKELTKNKKKIILRKKIDFEYIEIKNLNFKYGTKKILEKFSLLVKRNEKIGIMGKSGSGKTTLINLFLGLLNSEKKSIFLLDKNKEKISDIDYLKMSHVSQEVFIFDDTLINNICIPGDKKINKILLKKILKQADLNDFVRKLPKGLHTKLGERGSKISGGQKQRIGIARALYHETNLLIFDEITSSLDVTSEKKIIEVITKIKDKTILFITHKKNNLKSCDKIINISSR